MVVASFVLFCGQQIKPDSQSSKLLRQPPWQLYHCGEKKKKRKRLVRKRCVDCDTDRKRETVARNDDVPSQQLSARCIILDSNNSMDDKDDQEKIVEMEYHDRHDEDGICIVQL